METRKGRARKPEYATTPKTERNQGLSTRVDSTIKISALESQNARTIWVFCFGFVFGKHLFWIFFVWEHLLPFIII